MLREDYLIRMIAQLVDILHYALGLAKDKAYVEALSTLKDATQRLFALSNDLLAQLNGAELAHLLTLGERESDGAKKCMALATILHEQANLYTALDDPEQAYRRNVQALQLMLAIKQLPTEPYLAQAPTITQLSQTLSGYSIPPETAIALLGYFEHQGNFSAAEDMLFTNLDLNPDPGLVAAGIAFYQRLQTLTDEVLAAGNLPRDEVEASLSELQAYT
jgi:hypothetical protein